MRPEKLTSRFQEALSEAQSLAVGRDHNAIDPVHVLASLLAQDGGSIQPLLQAAGVNGDLLRTRLQQALERLPRLGHATGEVSVSPDLLRLLNLADKLAQKRGDHEIDANQELRALGSANAIGSLFGAYPVTGGFSRTAVNGDSGARTGLSALFAATVIGIAVVFLTPVLDHLPSVVLAGIIMVAVIGLVEFPEAREFWRVNKRDFVTFTCVFVIVLLVGIEQGLLVGVVVSWLLGRCRMPWGASVCSYWLLLPSWLPSFLLLIVLITSSRRWNI